jgi:hypothetical protein
MVFTKRLRERVRRGEITCSVRIWQQPRVIVGNRYKMEEGEIEVDSIEPIGLPDITSQLAQASGFFGGAGFVKGGQAWEGRQDISGALPLRAASARRTIRLSCVGWRWVVYMLVLPARMSSLKLGLMKVRASVSSVR